MTPNHYALYTRRAKFALVGQCIKDKIDVAVRFANVIQRRIHDELSLVHHAYAVCDAFHLGNLMGRKEYRCTGPALCHQHFQELLDSNRIETIRTAYKKQFEQESVLRDDSLDRVSF